MTDQTSEPKRIFLWLSPRSLSTVFEKCVAHMDDSMMWHEPYVSMYFNRVFANPKVFDIFPGMKTFYSQFEKAMGMLDSVKHQYEGGNLETSTKFTFEYIRDQLEKPLDEGKKFMFIKDATFGIDGHHDKLPTKGNFKHTFVIRNPNRQALSVQTILKHLYEWEGDMNDFNIGKGVHPFMSWDMLGPDPTYSLWKHVRENIDPNPVVIDADDLQDHPQEIMKKYCEAVGLPWKDKYLTWDSSPDYLKYLHGSLEEIVWGQTEGVYKRAFESSKFLPTSGPPPEKIYASCQGYAAEFWEGYKVMYEHRLKPAVK